MHVIILSMDKCIKKIENIDKIVTDKIGKWTVLTYTYEYKSQF